MKQRPRIYYTETDKSLNRSLRDIQSNQRLGVYGYGVSDVEIGVSAIKFATRSKDND